MHLVGRRHRPASDRDGDARHRTWRARARRFRGQHLLPQRRPRRLQRAVCRARGAHRARGRTRAGQHGGGAADPSPPGRGMNEVRDDNTQLRRGLNAWDATLLVLGLVVGGGIFLTPPSIAKSIPSAGWILGVWIVGGLLSIFGGFVYSELGTMMPEPGGMYLYIGKAFGALPGFLYAWVAYFVILAGADAAVAVGFAEYLSVFFPRLGNNRILFHLGVFPISAGQVVAVAAVLILSATHYIGIKEGSRIQGFFTSLIVLALLGMVIGGVLVPVPASNGAAAAHPPIPLAALGTAMVAVFWVYYGW